MTTLDWAGPGSFLEAITATEPRIIVFRVAGVIDVPNGVTLGEANSYVTVAGQTSPGGITFAGGGSAFLSSYSNNFHDAIFRFLRFRGDDDTDDSIAFHTAHQLVFDHCDFSAGRDETFDITFSHHVTLQWSTVMNSNLTKGGKGSLIAYPPTAGFSFHHNLYAHHGARFFPHMHWAGGGVPSTGAVIEFSNNVGYNSADPAAMYLVDPPDTSNLFFNLVGNYIKGGPDTPSDALGYALVSGSSVYRPDNVYPGYSLWSIYRTPTDLSERAPAPPIGYHSSDEAYALVLAKAGAFPRDPMNVRVVQEALSGTGHVGKFDDPPLATSWAVPDDADLDGMPDDWETERGLDPADPADAALDGDGDGYTNVEEYINGVAAFLIPD